MRLRRLLSIAVLCTACLAPQEQPPCDPIVEVAWSGGSKLGGCAAGDLWPENPGEEIAVVAEDGRVLMIWPTATGWASEVVATLPGEAIQCAVGDLDPSHPGAELVTVGKLAGPEDLPGPGVAILFRRQGKRWDQRELLREDSLLHAVAIGRVCPLHEGEQVVLAGFDKKVSVLDCDASGLPSLVAEAELTGAAKGAAVGLGGAVLALDNGALVRVQRRSGGFGAEVLWQGTSPLSRVDADRTRALFAANDGCLREWAGGEARTLYSAADRLRGAVLADLCPSQPGLEAATAGYDGRVVLIERGSIATTPAPDEAHTEVVHRTSVLGRDDARLHHLTLARLLGRGPALVTCGYSGKVLVLRPSRP